MKPLIIGGTTEGRIAVEVCEEAGKPFYYSTKGSSQVVKMHNGISLTGGMDAREMLHFCQENEVKLIIDAAHPFASAVHRNIGKVGDELMLPIIRLERHFPKIPEEVIEVANFDKALDLLLKLKVGKVLALTGVNSISKLESYWRQHDTYFRVMPIPDTEKVLSTVSLPQDKVIYYDSNLPDDELFQKIQPELILLKESGATSGFEEKVEVALELGIKVVVISRPPLGYNESRLVTGKVGLRRAIEQLLPSFFPLRIGFTTGTTATAATIAALQSLLSGEEVKAAEVELPIGEVIPFPIQSIHIHHDSATAVAIKYAGDDPDVTDGAEIHSTVRLTNEHTGVHFLQGEGVGVITLPGIGLPIGDPAINSVPRRMIRDSVSQLVDTEERGVDITISVPKGEELGAQTFNPRLGIIGGISILGTTGVVRPYSLDTWVASIGREMQVSKAVGVNHLVLNSGGRSERFLKERFPELPSNAFVQYGNFIGESLTMAKEHGFSKVTLGIMIGKAIKLANGELDTHSKKVTMDMEFVGSLVQKSGASSVVLKSVEKITMARELWDVIPDRSAPLYQMIIQHCFEVCQPLVPECDLEILLIDNQGQFITREL